jgi:hypothetical protein
MHGAPELIAQALDKLFDNARSFAPEDGWIRLSLHTVAEGAEIRVANSGPLLPPAMQERLFDSLVSVRPSAPARPLSAMHGLPGTGAPARRSGEARADAPHLGLGLYVVRMIADLHRGEARARNLNAMLCCRHAGKPASGFIAMDGVPRGMPPPDRLGFEHATPALGMPEMQEQFPATSLRTGGVAAATFPQ